jgi:hypothetical protein
MRIVADRLHLRIRDLGVDYRDTVSCDRWPGRVQSADGDPTGDGSRISLDASVNERPVRLTGTIPTPRQLIRRGESMPADLAGELLGLAVQAKGTLADPRAGGEMVATLSLQGDSLGALAPWLGDDASKIGPVNATCTSRVARTASAWRLSS